jgi:hypothetical protein
MSEKRRNHTPEFKAKVALAAIEVIISLTDVQKHFINLNPS